MSAPAAPRDAAVSFDHIAAPGGTVMRSSMGLAVRGLRSIRRLPSAFLPAMMMPIFQAIAFSGTFFAITKIPGFPTDRSINWYLPFAVCMGSGFSGVGLGFSTVRDIETGFFDRLRMAPTPATALVLGPLLACWFRVLIVVTVVLGHREDGSTLSVHDAQAIISSVTAHLAAAYGIGHATLQVECDECLTPEHPAT